ncbi:MAG: DUF2339 domain-containing protein [Planctomycetota bacterium]
MTSVSQMALHIESQLWNRIAVWVGSLALALAGVFLVKWFVDEGLLTEPVRVALGLGFGLAMLLVGDRIRRAQPLIASGLTGAGIAVLYAALLVATNSYHLVAPVVGFIAMIVVTAGAVTLSLRHGAFIALLGLLGGFLTPALVQTDGTSPALLFSYLFVLQAGLLVVTRHRAWAWLAGLTIGGAMLWVALWLAFRWQAGHGTAIAPFLVASLAAVVFAVRPPRAGDAAARDTAWGTTLAERSLTWGAAIAGMLLMCVLVAISGFSTFEWTFLGVLGAGTLVLGRLDARYEGIAWLGSAFTLALLATWGIVDRPLHPATFGPICTALGGLFGGGAYIALFGAHSRARWALLSMLSVQGALLIAYFALWPVDGHGLIERSWTDHLPIDWTAICCIISAICTLAIVPVLRTRTADEVQARFDAVDVLATGVFVLLTLAVWEGTRFEWITVCWAVLIAVGVFVSRWLHCFGLRWAAARLALLVALRLLANPMIANYPLGTPLLWNWMLHGYGVPVAALGLSAWLVRRDDRRLAHYFTLLAGASGVFLWVLQVRHAFHPGQLAASSLPFAEWTTIMLGGLLIAQTLLLLHRRREWASFVWLAAGLGALGAGMAALGLGLIYHPYLMAAGPPTTFATCVIGYALTAPVLFMVGRQLYRTHHSGLHELGNLLEGTAIATVAVLLSIIVRDLFGPRLSLSGTEWSAHIVVQLAWAISVLAASRRLPYRVVEFMGRALTTVCIGLTAMPLLGTNPLLHRYVASALPWPPLIDLLFAYGLPAWLLAVAAAELWLKRRDRDDPMMHTTAFISVILAATLIVLLVRLAFNGPDFRAQPFGILESAVSGNLLMAFGLLLAWRMRALPISGARLGAQCTGLAGLALIVTRCVVVGNPLWAQYDEAVFLPRAVELLIALGGGSALAAATHRWLLADLPADHPLRRGVAIVGMVMLALLPVPWVRLAYHPQGMAGRPVSLAEWGLLCSVELLIGAALGRAALRKGGPYPVLHAGSIVLLGGALLMTIVVPCIGRNPLRTGEAIGGSLIVNSLLLAYGLPALLAALLSRALRNVNREVGYAVGAIAVALLTLLVTLEVRHVFHGTVLRGGTILAAEQNAYSLAWIGLGMGLLGATIISRSVVMRYASAVVMVVAVCKVFLVDMAELRDLLRVVSFFGLGVSLLLLAWIYQRIAKPPGVSR